MQNTYEQIPDFDQTTQCVVQGEPINTGDEIHYPVIVIDLPNTIDDKAGLITVEPIELKISKEGTVNVDDLVSADISIADVCDRTNTVSMETVAMAKASFLKSGGAVIAKQSIK